MNQLRTSDLRVRRRKSVVTHCSRSFVAQIRTYIDFAHPVEGGSANDYDYANQEPCNTYDLDGRKAVSRALDRGARSQTLARYNKCMATYKKFGTAYKYMMGLGSPGAVSLAYEKYDSRNLRGLLSAFEGSRMAAIASKASAVVGASIFVFGFGAYGGQVAYCEFRAGTGHSS